MRWAGSPIWAGLLRWDPGADPDYSERSSSISQIFEESVYTQKFLKVILHPTATSKRYVAHYFFNKYRRNLL